MRIWSRREILVGGIGCVLAACSHGQAGNVVYSVSTSGEGNQVAIAQSEEAEPGAYFAAIYSERGIGQASIVWWGNPLPHHLVFQLTLSGLEQFTLRWADQAVNLSVNSMDHTVIQRAMIGNADEMTIAANSPYWMEVEMPTADAPAFLVNAPQAFIDAAPRLWGISWIDFYR